MSGDTAEKLSAAATDAVSQKKNVNRERCIIASREMFSVLARYATSVASTIVRSVAGLDGVETWTRLHANRSRRAFRHVQSAA